MRFIHCSYDVLLNVRHVELFRIEELQGSETYAIEAMTSDGTKHFVRVKYALENIDRRAFGGITAVEAKDADNDDIVIEVFKTKDDARFALRELHKATAYEE